MKYITLIALFLIILSCKKNNNAYPENWSSCIENNKAFIPEEFPKSDEYQFIFHANSKIDISENERINSVSIAKGTLLVFEFNYTKNDNPGIADDEISEVIYFEVEPELDSFLLTTGDLQAANGVYGLLCFCVDRGYHRLSDGCIRGEKLTKNSWQIDIYVEATASNSTFSKIISEVFYLNEKLLN